MRDEIFRVRRRGLIWGYSGEGWWQGVATTNGVVAGGVGWCTGAAREVQNVIIMLLLLCVGGGRERVGE